MNTRNGEWLKEEYFDILNMNGFEIENKVFVNQCGNKRLYTFIKLDTMEQFWRIKELCKHNVSTHNDYVDGQFKIININDFLSD